MSCTTVSSYVEVTFLCPSIKYLKSFLTYDFLSPAFLCVVDNFCMFHSCPDASFVCKVLS